MEARMRQHNLAEVVSVCVMALIICLGSGCQSGPEAQLVILSGGLSNHNGYYLVDWRGHRFDISRGLGAQRVYYRPAVWSPRGDRVAYLCSVDTDDTPEICDVDVSTMTMQVYELPGTGKPDSLAWSMDETSLLLVWKRAYPEPSELWQLDRAAQQLNMLSRLPAGAEDVDWSPDRSFVAFTVEDDQSGRDVLYIQKVDGTFTEAIYDHERLEGPVWSPSGGIIAFTTGTVFTGVSLCWMLIQEGAEVCLQEAAGDLAWSPDGKSIAFAGSGGIHVADVWAGTVQDLVAGDVGVLLRNPNWSPDGVYLAYDSCCCQPPNETCEVHIVSSDGKKHWQLTKNWISDEFPVWRPIVSTTTD